MNNKRIDLTRWRKHVTKDWNPDVRHENQDYIDDLLTLLNALERCYEELDRPKVTIDDWDKEGPCVTVYLEGKEYVGILREYDASE